MTDVLPTRVDWDALSVDDVDSEHTLAPYQGDTYQFTFQIFDEDGVPFDLTGWSMTCQVRRVYAEEDADGANDPLSEITTTGGGIVYTDATLGQGTGTFTPAQTVLWTGTERLRYDLQAVNVSDVDFTVGYTKTGTFGTIRVIKDVTR